jgi:ribosomal protein S18 acetylase RimI-like enzyme
LHAFDAESGPFVLSWIPSAEELLHWAARTDFPLADVAVFSSWHADPDVSPFELRMNGDLAGYGEIWCEQAEAWAEIARVIIAPPLRGRGFGKKLVDMLAEQVRLLGFDDVWVRLFPANSPARNCYESVGFVRTSLDRERELNALQPNSYIWLRRQL